MNSANALLRRTQPAFVIDPVLAKFNEYAYDSQLVQDVWKKYLWKDETTPDEVYKRVSKAIAYSDAEHGDKEAVSNIFYDLMSKRLFLPGGRILAGAGTSKRVTLMNCYVNGTIDDSMEGIAEGIKNLMLTMQQGGGMGTAFETIRPNNALLRRTQSAASGPGPFIDQFSATGKTIRSAADRRGAQMGTLSDTHPDLPDFIKAKGEGLKAGDARWSELNVSVLISDSFMAAVEEDETWVLYFDIPPVNERQPDIEAYDFVDEAGVKQFVYSVWRARDLWELILKYTYDYADPGIIFIDRVNEWNNLSYIENIRCTNPCGEQPLPPHGTCNLGAINVSQCVIKPFTPDAYLNLELVAEVTRWGVRFLDNVIEVTGYPLPEQQEEEFTKRRIGLGITGLGTAFASLQMKYGSKISTQLASILMKTIAHTAYEESARLAEERGCFPAFDHKMLGCGFISKKIPDYTIERIRDSGIRNGVLLTIAPVGTGSIAFGNISSGLEPDFAHQYDRKVRQENKEEWKTYTERSYTKRLYDYITETSVDNSELPEYMTTALELPVEDHVKVQAALQKWVDASVSKTINCPRDMSYEDFKAVYDLAYESGCKGCTTYRDSPLRGSILSTTTTTEEPVKEPRGEVLQGNTYRFDWHSMSSSMYVTINYRNNQPYEIFFASKDARYSDWMTGLTLMISSIFRSDIDPEFIPGELKQVISMHDGGWHKGKFYGSMVARIGEIIENDFIYHGIIEKPEESNVKVKEVKINEKSASPGIEAICPQCGQPTLTMQEGCKKCLSCGYSAC